MRCLYSQLEEDTATAIYGKVPANLWSLFVDAAFAIHQSDTYVAFLELHLFLVLWVG